MADATKQAVVLAGAARFVNADGTTGRGLMGETVDLSADEFDRLEALGAVASPKSKAGKEAAEAEEAE